MNKVFSKIAGLSVGLAMAIGVGVAVGQKSAARVDADEVLYHQATFETADNSGKIGDYTSTWSTTHDEFEWTIQNFNNNNLGWDGFVKCGRKNYTSVASVATASAVSDKVTKVSITIDALTASKINSITLFKGTSADAITTSLGTFDKSVGIKTITIPSASQAKDLFYKIQFDCDSGSSNGLLTLSNVSLYHESTATLQSISLVKGEGAKVSYVDGDSVSFADIKAVGHYSDSTESDVSSSCTITADRAKVATGETKITYSATYTPGGFTIADLDVSITVVDLAIEKVEKNGNYRLDFVQKQKFSYGTGKVKVTWNNGTSQALNPTADGVTAKIGTTDITGQTHYMTLDDDGKDLVMSYGGKSFTVGTVTVTPYVEPESGYWSPITNVSELEADMEVIIVASEHDFAMGKYTTGNNVTAIDTSKDEQGKISSSIPGVQVYTLVESDVVAGTYAFYDGSKYLAATGGTSSNYLKVEDEISANSSFAVSINAGVMSIVGQGSTASGARMTMRYNNNDLVFSCYASNSGVGSLACLYKFTPESKSADQIAVENFCKTSLHLDDSDPSYIDPNNNTSGTACKGETGYYALAKEAYDVLTAAQKEIFATSADVLIAQGRARLTAWAEANEETFDAVAGTFSAYIPSFAIASDDNNTMIIVISIAAVSALAFTALLVFKKRKQK